MNKAERTNWLAHQALELIEAAIAKNDERGADLLSEIGETLGHDGVYAVCRALASAIRAWAFPDFTIGDGSLTGEMAFIQSDDETDVDVLWAGRFLTAHLNGDTATSQSLFFGNLDHPAIILGGVAALVMMAGDIGRAYLENRPGEQGHNTEPGSDR